MKIVLAIVNALWVTAIVWYESDGWAGVLAAFPGALLVSLLGGGEGARNHFGED